MVQAALFGAAVAVGATLGVALARPLARRVEDKAEDATSWAIGRIQAFGRWCGALKSVEDDSPATPAKAA